MYYIAGGKILWLGNDVVDRQLRIIVFDDFILQAATIAWGWWNTSKLLSVYNHMHCHWIHLLVFHMMIIECIAPERNVAALRVKRSTLHFWLYLIHFKSFHIISFLFLKVFLCLSNHRAKISTSKRSYTKTKSRLLHVNMFYVQHKHLKSRSWLVY